MSQTNEIHREEPALDPVRQEEAKQYARARLRVTFADLALGGLILLLLVFGGLSQKLTGLLTLSAVPEATLYIDVRMVAYGAISATLSRHSGVV